MEKAGRRVLSACAAAVLALACGCHSAPRMFVAADLKSPGAIEKNAQLYWRPWRLEPLADPAEAPTRPRAVIIECSVRFITHKFAGLFEREGVVGTSEISRYMVLPSLFGVGRQDIRYGEDLKKRLPGELRALLAEELEQAGFEVVPNEDVAAAPSYKRFRKGRPGAPDPLYLFNFVATDTGRVKRIETWPAEGLAVIKGATGGSVARAARDVMKETGADVAVRARIWVGVWRGRASVERGTRLDIVTAEDTGSAISEKSLVSEETVIDLKQFKIFRGEVLEVVGEQYGLALSYLWPPYVEMAMELLVGER